MEGYPPPYRPFRGALPPHFVDRCTDDIGMLGVVEASLKAFSNGPADPRFHRFVVAGAGMGKTALLRFVCREAEARLGWASVLHRCSPKQSAIGVLGTLVAAAVKRRWQGASLLVEARGDGSAWSQLHDLLRQSARLRPSVAQGVLVALDDADLLGAGEVQSLGYLAQNLAREALPVAIWMSVRPWLARRFEHGGDLLSTLWPTLLGPLEGSEAREAIVVPAAERGVEFEAKALTLACAAAGGSPLEVQRVGFASWAAAGGRRRVRVADIKAALAGEGFRPERRRDDARERLLAPELLRATFPLSLPA